MRIFMTLQAIRKFTVQPRFMRLPMTVDAIHGRTVIALVATDTVQFTMFGLGRRQHAGHITVAGRAVIG